ncbi:cytochrome b [Rhizobium sp. PDO1-076]|uniref:cytochrome b n=1 Tax=Rhizobium sp. PDO1-076 TaxID=1125979 RepID=UPI001FCA6F83|nr:cytochrome b [Rhizobium sp. PDO1-076]
MSKFSDVNLFSQAVCPSDAINSVHRYAATSRIIHWVVAALVLVTWPLGLVIQFTRNEVSLGFYMLHESFGFLLLWLMLLRVGNKMIAKTPHHEGSAFERFAASTVHGLLYLLLIVMPVSGFLAISAHGFPLVWFGLVPIWGPLDKSPDIAGILSMVHTWSAWVVLLLFALHIGAVLLHHVIKRDNTLYRIL